MITEELSSLALGHERGTVTHPAHIATLLFPVDVQQPLRYIHFCASVTAIQPDGWNGWTQGTDETDEKATPV